MTQEKKARAYDKALERARIWQNHLYRTNNSYYANELNYIFPELKESEDEKIRKQILSFLKEFEYDHYRNLDFSSWIAWLEKQSDKPQGKTALEPIKEEKVDNQTCVKPADKFKPKFKVGDWISNDMCDVHIASIENGMYYFDEGDGLSIVFVDEHYHIWTIQDAKDGDVLFHSDSASNGIFIFKEIIDKGFAKEVISYCDYDSEDHFCLGEHHTCCWTDAKILHPANKEQRDLLFQKMKEAGYEWHINKKELRKKE